MKVKFSKIIISTVVSIFAFLCLFPFILVVSGSLSSEIDILTYGFEVIPRHISISAYKALFVNFDAIVNAYKITIMVTVIGTTFSILICSLAGYAMSRKEIKGSKFISVYVLLTLLFNGGMVPWYIICVNYLHLKDSIISLIIPYLANAWYIFLFKNFFRSIPDAIHESAKIDGAGEYTIFFKIILSLSTPVLATVGLFTALGYWNDWWLGLMLIDRNELQPLQLLLRSVESNVDFLRSMSNNTVTLKGNIPTEGVRMAICVVTIGPIIFLYPFLQRFFIKGIMIGAVKG